MKDETSDTINRKRGWEDAGYNSSLSRQKEKVDERYISGSKFDAQLDDMLFNRMIRFKNLSQTPQGNDPAKVYYDKDTKKLKMWIDSTGKWAELIYTTTSTSTTSSSSTTTTSSSTSTSSTSTT